MQTQIFWISTHGHLPRFALIVPMPSFGSYAPPTCHGVVVHHARKGTGRRRGASCVWSSSSLRRHSHQSAAGQSFWPSPLLTRWFCQAKERNPYAASCAASPRNLFRSRAIGFSHTKGEPLPRLHTLTEQSSGWESANGWKLDVGEGLSLVALSCSIREAFNPARVQHVDQLLCREACKNRHWSSCAIEPRHPPVGTELQQFNIGANGQEVRCDSIRCISDALRDDKINYHPAQVFGQIRAELEAGDRLDAPLSGQGSCERIAQQG